MPKRFDFLGQRKPTLLLPVLVAVLLLRLNGPALVVSFQLLPRMGALPA